MPIRITDLEKEKDKDGNELVGQAGRGKILYFRAYGSVVYEEVGSDDMVLEFFTSRFGSKGDESGELEYP